jgi:hypothetical protein
MKGNRARTILITAIVAILATAIAFTVARESSDDGWAERAGRAVMQSSIVRHPLAKGGERCFLVTREGGITAVDCDAFRDLIINPAPPALSEE